MVEYHYLGDQNLDPNLNLAMDEILLNRTKPGIVYLRFYSFSRPVMILSYTESIEDVRSDYLTERGISLSRRLSAGGVMYCDQNSLCYSLIGRRDDLANQYGIHEKHGRKIGDVLSEEMGCQIYLGKHFSLRTNPDVTKILAGHGVRLTKDSYLYHGIIATEPWDLNLLSGGIVLSPREEEIIPQLPYLSRPKPHMVRRLLEGVTDGNYRVVESSELDEIVTSAKHLARNKYNRDHWIHEAKATHDAQGLRTWTGGGFCFCVTRGNEPLL